MYTSAPEGELPGELGVWRRTVMDPCGPGRTSVSTAPIDGQGPTPSCMWSRRPCAIGTSAPRVGPDGSHASSSGSRTPRPTMSGTCAASYTGIFGPSGRAGNRSSDRRARLQAHGSAFKGVDDLLSSGDLAEVGEDLGEGVRVGRGVDVGDGIFGEDQVVAVFPGAARCGFHPDAGGDACQNDLALVLRPPQPISAPVPASSRAVIASTPLRETGSCAPTRAQATPSRIRCLACSRTRSGTSASVVPASQVASRPVGPAGSVAASEERGAALVPVISMVLLHSVSWSASASLPLARVGWRGTPEPACRGLQ